MYLGTSRLGTYSNKIPQKCCYHSLSHSIRTEVCWNVVSGKGFPLFHFFTLWWWYTIYGWYYEHNNDDEDDRLRNVIILKGCVSRHWIPQETTMIWMWIEFRNGFLSQKKIHLRWLEYAFDLGHIFFLFNLYFWWLLSIIIWMNLVNCLPMRTQHGFGCGGGGFVVAFVGKLGWIVEIIGFLPRMCYLFFKPLLTWRQFT